MEGMIKKVNKDPIEVIEEIFKDIGLDYDTQVCTVGDVKETSDKTTNRDPAR